MRPRKLQTRIDHWIFDSHAQSAESLSFYRVVFSLFLLIFAMPDSTWVSELPDVIFNPPPGPLSLFDGYPPRVFFQVLEFILCISTIALLLGVNTRASSLSIGVLMITLIGFEHCLGKIDHNRVLICFTPLALAYSTWGKCYAVDPPRGSDTAANANWPQTLLALLFGLFFLSAGIPKVWGGWLSLADQRTRMFLGRSDVGNMMTNGWPDFFFEALDYATIGFEIGFIFAVVAGLRWTRIFCALAVLFHLSIVVMVGINFPEQIIIYGAFVDWDRIRVFRHVGRKIDSLYRRIHSTRWGVVVIGGIVYFALHITIGSPLSTNSNYSFNQRLAYWLPPVGVACWYLYSQLQRAGNVMRQRTKP